jgi:hypothetical protein
VPSRNAQHRQRADHRVGSAQLYQARFYCLIEVAGCHGGVAPRQGGLSGRPAHLIEHLRQEHAALLGKGGGLAGYACFPIPGLDKDFTDAQVNRPWRRLSPIFDPDLTAWTNSRSNSTSSVTRRWRTQPDGTGVSVP